MSAVPNGAHLIKSETSTLLGNRIESASLKKGLVTLMHCAWQPFRGQKFSRGIESEQEQFWPSPGFTETWRLF